MARRILVADSATIQKVVKIVFSRFDLEVAGSSSLMEASSEISRLHPDLLIVDAGLPGSKGPEDFAKLASEAGGIPAIILVGSYESIDEESFRVFGLTRFVKKPFEAAEMIAAAADAGIGGLSPEMRDRDQGPPRRETGGGFPPPLDSANLPPGFAPPPPPPPARKTPPPATFQLADLGSKASRDDQSELSADLSDLMVQNPGSRPETDQAKRGRRAFPIPDLGSERAADDADVTVMRSISVTEAMRMPPPIYVPESTPATPPLPRAHSVQPPEISRDIEGMISDEIALKASSLVRSEPARRTHSPGDVRTASPLLPSDDEMGRMVRSAVEDYCARHFKSLAREVISAELKRLADEKARHLVDN